MEAQIFWQQSALASHFFPVPENVFDEAKSFQHRSPSHFLEFNKHSKMAVEIKLGKGEAMDKALRRMKKKLDRENIIRDVRAKRYFEKPCEERRRKRKVQAFNNMLRQRYENM